MVTEDGHGATNAACLAQARARGVPFLFGWGLVAQHLLQEVEWPEDPAELTGLMHWMAHCGVGACA